jgi:hypothetical protein
LPEPMIPGSLPARGLVVGQGGIWSSIQPWPGKASDEQIKVRGRGPGWGTSRSQLSSRALTQARYASAPGPPSRYHPIKASIQLPD